MALRTVKVPPALEPLFEQAEAVVSAYFGDRHDDPSRGTIEIQGERYLLVRAASLSVEFFGFVRGLLGPGREGEADEFSRNILFDLAHSIGAADARAFHEKMGLEDPIARLSAGPVHFAHSGWAFVEIAPESSPTAGPDYFLLYDHPYSFESDAWRRSGRLADFPACIMNAGYSAGWCEESFGQRLVASEILCRACGDEVCRFVMAPPERIEERVRAYLESAPEVAARGRNWRIPDLFARKRLEDELRAARDQLEARVEARTEELRVANERLLREIAERADVERRLLQSQKLEALGRLAGGIAHDFNSVLMAISGASELMLDDLPPDHPLADLAADVLRATDRATQLTNQLLVFSRHEPSAPDVVDLGENVQGMVAMLRRLIGDAIQLDCSVAGGQHFVCVEPHRIEQVILNVALNARDAMPDGGRLTLAVSRVPDKPGGADRVRLTLRDDGEGMEPEVLDRIFDPFFTTKGPGRGTGLGLATVHGIVHQAGGTIQVESLPGQGTTFWIDLPAATGPVTRAAAVRRGLGEPREGEGVLLVEDDAAVRRLLGLALERSGCRVVMASSASEASAAFASRGDEVDLLVSDVRLPDEDGVALARSLRKTRPDLRVLFVSGMAGDADEPPDLGADPMLRKPFTLGRFRRAVRAALDA